MRVENTFQVGNGKMSKVMSSKSDTRKSHKKGDGWSDQVKITEDELTQNKPDVAGKGFMIFVDRDGKHKERKKYRPNNKRITDHSGQREQ